MLHTTQSTYQPIYALATRTPREFFVLPMFDQVTVNGKTVKAVQGQRLRDVVLAAKAKIEYGCEKVGCAPTGFRVVSR